MRILYIHNDYAKLSGEETAAEAIVELLKEHGHEVAWHRRSSAEIAGSAWGHIKSLFTGLVNPCEGNAVAKHIQEFKPDIVQVQNIYPLLSPSIFLAIRKCGVPIVMRCPNYRLFCPNGLCCDKQGHVCEECFDGHEWRCAFKNCTGSPLKSMGYALRGWAARVTRRILDNVDVFIVQTEFQRKKFIAQGIPEEKIGIVPGIMQSMEPEVRWCPGKYVTYVGRVSEEKGIVEFLEVARRLPDIPFMVTGSYDDMQKICKSVLANVTWTGFLKGEKLRQAYLDSRIVVVPSRCYEGFPNVIVQAMQLERPVITTDLGASGSIVEEGVTGEKFRPMDVDDLYSKIIKCYDNVEQCEYYGKAGRKKALENYSRDIIYEILIGLYKKLLP